MRQKEHEWSENPLPFYQSAYQRLWTSATQNLKGLKCKVQQIPGGDYKQLLSCKLWSSLLMPLPAVSSTDNRDPYIIISKITPRSPNRDIEYCLLSKEQTPIQQNRQKSLISHMSGGPQCNMVCWGPTCITACRTFSSSVPT